MNTNNENIRRDALQRVSTTDQISAQPRRDAIYGVSTASEIFRPIRNGILFALGFFGTTIFAVAISGTIKTWTSGELLKSADLNTTISSMKTAIEGIPNWTKASNGTDAYYTAGNVGIGTSSPSALLDIAGQATSGFISYNNTGGIPFTIRNGSYKYDWVIDTTNIYLQNNLTSLLTVRGSNGNVTVAGALSKGSGTFDIAHPDPSMPKNARLRHSFVESPTAGDNIYRWQIKVTRENGKFFIRLPKYWTHLNANPMV
ncbi:MAG TPA: hypothetical protein PL169_05830, partial [Leptospiraceae bacterium]|nr:hypothetical protein [Leptospiraceae bacterium]